MRRITRGLSLLVVTMFLTMWFAGISMAVSESTDQKAENGTGIVDKVTDQVADKVTDKVTSKAKEAVAEVEKKGEQLVGKNLAGRSLGDILRHPVFLVLVVVVVISLVTKLIKVAISVGILAVLFVVAMNYLK